MKLFQLLIQHMRQLQVLLTLAAVSPVGITAAVQNTMSSAFGISMSDLPKLNAHAIAK